ncbi:uncharacterized protein [Anoplolepis gracilipes]|uniref:uncharacterized protein isoform X2 n=1 Tax=Anoplolepis gracilipes TaxID=354296 RepID=UPI003BA10105
MSIDIIRYLFRVRMFLRIESIRATSGSHPHPRAPDSTRQNTKCQLSHEALLIIAMSATCTVAPVMLIPSSGVPRTSTTGEDHLSIYSSTVSSTQWCLLSSTVVTQGACIRCTRRRIDNNGELSTTVLSGFIQFITTFLPSTGENDKIIDSSTVTDYGVITTPNITISAVIERDLNLGG